MDDCIFCKIVRGEIPSYKVYEDDLVLAFLDAFPSHRAHTLVIPKEHFTNFFDLPEEIAEKIMKVAKLLANVVNEVLKPDGLNVIQNNGELAGQEIMHYHLHLIPRYKNTSPKGLASAFKTGEYKYSPTSGELAEIAEIFAKNLNIKN